MFQISRSCCRVRSRVGMEREQWWKVRVSLKNATIAVTVVNVVFALALLQGFLSSSSSASSRYPHFSQSAQLKYLKESEEMRLAMLPLELIKRVKEIEQQGFVVEPERVQQKDTKQTGAAVDLSKRLKDMRSSNDASSFRALEEWRKRKMERARRRELEKNGTVTSQA